MVATEKPKTNFNKSLLSSFVLPTKEFEEFVSQRISLINLDSSVVKENRNGFQIKLHNTKVVKNYSVVEKIYRKLIKGGSDYAVVFRSKDGVNIVFCKEENYKQILFNIRSKHMNYYKNLFKKERSNYMLQMLQLKKVNFSRDFIVSVYGVKQDKYATYRPFKSLKKTPKKKHTIVNPIQFST
jgi:hypothetical protein